MTPADLQAEILTGPMASQLAPHVHTKTSAVVSSIQAAADDQAIADLLNSTTSSGAALVNIPSFSKEQFSTGVLPAIEALPTASAALQTKWNAMLNVMLAQGGIALAAVSSLVAQLVIDGLMTQAQVDAFTKRQGSRAEALWGAGTIITAAQVSVALRG